MKSLIVHYQEIALKGKNRPWFIARLVHNLRAGTRDVGVREVRPLMGRIEIILDPTARLGRRFAPAWRACSAWPTLPGPAGRALDIEAIAAAILARPRTGQRRLVPGVGRAAPTSGFR